MGQLVKGEAHLGQVLLTSCGTAWKGFNLEISQLQPQYTPGSRMRNLPALFITTRGSPTIRWRDGRKRFARRWKPGDFTYIADGHSIADVEIDSVTSAVALEMDLLLISSIRWDEDIDLSALSCAYPHQMGADETIFHLINSMVREVRAGCPTGAVFAESLSVALACHLLRRITDRTSARMPCQHGLSMQKLKLLKDFIENNLCSDIKLSDLCDIAQLGPRHLSRSFKDATGTTPHRFILRSRIIRAQELLASGASATDTALQLGFASPSHFSDAFKKINGVSPRQYLQSQ